MAKVTDAELATAVRSILKTADLRLVTVKVVRRKAEERLGLKDGDLETDELKKKVGDLVKKELDKRKPSDDDESDDEPPAPKPKVKAESKPAPKPKPVEKKKAAPAAASGEPLSKLERLRKNLYSCGLGAQWMKGGFKQMSESDALSALTTLLKENNIPTDRVISKQEGEKIKERISNAKEFAELDSTLILDSKQRATRGRAAAGRPAVTAKVDYGISDSEESEEEQPAEDDEEVAAAESGSDDAADDNVDEQPSSSDSGEDEPSEESDLSGSDSDAPKKKKKSKDVKKSKKSSSKSKSKTSSKSKKPKKEQKRPRKVSKRQRSASVSSSDDEPKHRKKIVDSDEDMDD
eukprot:TRINITY_DN191_c0_g1_i1.p1 TRINITY_DN191_c0_g1~~TRINITY_DN191_c0_g1_i1.p1  ORF type:complete len:363 (+),score=89.43 TRINITY_DN191_c0_g1_i1:45-1091(+)